MAKTTPFDPLDEEGLYVASLVAYSHLSREELIRKLCSLAVRFGTASADDMAAYGSIVGAQGRLITAQDQLLETQHTLRQTEAATTRSARSKGGKSRNAHKQWFYFWLGRFYHEWYKTKPKQQSDTWFLMNIPDKVAKQLGCSAEYSEPYLKQSFAKWKKTQPTLPEVVSPFDPNKVAEVIEWIRNRFKVAEQH